MLIAAHEKKQHPEYQGYVENFEATLTGLEAGLRGGGNPGLIVDKCLDIARSFYDCDSAALVETNLELGYGVCVSEHCKEGVVSYEGRVINVTADETPYLYEKIMHNDVFDVQEPKDSQVLSPYENGIMNKMSIQVLAVAPYYKRTSGYIYIRNPRRYVGLYGMLQALSYVCATERNEFKLMDRLNMAASQKKCKTDSDVFIKVFGGLSITTHFGTLTESEITSSLAVRLVAYLLLHRSRKVSQRELTDALWPNAEVDSPVKQVKNVVHRTRNILNPIFPDNLVISDKTGNYYLNPNIHLVTDAGLFESFYRYRMLPSSSRKEKIHYLRQATQLYEHEFLPNYTGDAWLDNQRAYYHLSYLKAIMELLPLLYQEEAYSEMYSVSNAALNLEPGNGDIQFWHMRAMISLGGIEIAQKHYSQHNQCLSEEQKMMLINLFNESH